MGSHIAFIAAASLAAAAAVSDARAEFTYFFQLPAWQQAAGPSTTIDFVQPVTTTITDQYESLGVLFTEGNDVAGTMLQTPSGDGWGLYSGAFNSTITIQFLQPINALAFHLPGFFQYQLYSGDTLLVTTFAGDPFQGFTSTVAFDRVVCFGGTAMDNLYFGAPVPAPGTAALTGALLLRPRRRRRDCARD
ncbi:MAG: hypothetical protein JNL80_01895 [Phycisphaerae bacterium]|nr:hypothetical protein [Phycisphaerae bacterium]